MQKWKGVQTAILLSTSLLNTFAFAQDSGGDDSSSKRPYFFSGSCASQGEWTQQALSMTDKIRQVTMQLENDPNCKQVAAAIEKSVASIRESLADAGQKKGDPNASQLASLPEEITSLRNMLTLKKSSQNQGLMSLMMDSTLRYSSLAAKQAASGVSGSDIGDPLGRFRARVGRATRSGLAAFNGMVDIVAQNTQCLKTPQQGAFLASATATLASFASSNQDSIGLTLAESIRKLGKFTRDIKFAEVYKTLDQNEFNSSMSCLLEAASDNYCSARDGIKLHQEMSRFQNEGKTQALMQKADGPLAGYYILTQHLPMISNWLQMIQIGADSQLSTDAQFKINVLNRVNMYWIGAEAIIGSLRESKKNILIQPDPNTQKNYVIQLIRDLTIALTGGNAAIPSSDFFTAQVTSVNVPYYLVGVATPPEVGSSNVNVDFYNNWLQLHYNEIPGSKDTAGFVKKIEDNLNELLRVARIAAITYYNKFYIVDKSSPYMKAMIGTNYNVRESLTVIDKYLAQLDAKVQKEKDYQGTLISIRETRAKIGRVLEAFKDMTKLSSEVEPLIRQAKDGNLFKKGLMNKELLTKITDSYKKFSTAVFNHFEVLLGKSGWLSNRISDYVYLDYSIMVRSKTDLNPYLRDLYYSTGLGAYDKLISMAGTSPALIEADLSQAMLISGTNINAIETLLKDNFYSNILMTNFRASRTEQAIRECGPLKPKNFEQLSPADKITIGNKIAACQAKYKMTPASVYWDQHKKSFMEGYDPTPEESNSGFISRVWRGVRSSFNGLVLNGDKYHLPSNREILNLDRKYLSWDNESGSARFIVNKLCTQVLAFNDLKTFWHICKNAVLESSFKGQLNNTVFAGTPDSYFRMSFLDKSYENIENPGLNLSNRICAARDYFRRNQALYMTLISHQKGQSSEDYVPDYSIEDSTDGVTDTDLPPPTKASNGKVGAAAGSTGIPDPSMADAQ